MADHLKTEDEEEDELQENTIHVDKNGFVDTDVKNIENR